MFRSPLIAGVLGEIERDGCLAFFSLCAGILTISMYVCIRIQVSTHKKPLFFYVNLAKVSERGQVLPSCLAGHPTVID
jgi:hypothetical protein